MPKEFELMRLAIKESLVADGKSEAEAEKSSWGLVTEQWKKTHDGKAPSSENYIDEKGKKRDEHGRFIVAENQRVTFEATINNIIEG